MDGVGGVEIGAEEVDEGVETLPVNPKKTPVVCGIDTVCRTRQRDLFACCKVWVKSLRVPQGLGSSEWTPGGTLLRDPESDSRVTFPPQRRKTDHPFDSGSPYLLRPTVSQWVSSDLRGPGLLSGCDRPEGCSWPRRVGVGPGPGVVLGTVHPSLGSVWE